MASAQPSATAEHWCARIAQRAGWPNADTLAVPVNTDIVAAWAAVITGCGVSEDQLAQEVARSYRLQLVRWETVEPQATKLVPERFARKHHVFPVREDYRSIYVATADPNDINAEQELGFASGRNPVFMIAAPSSIGTAIEAGYAPDISAATLLQAAGSDLENAVRVAENSAPEVVKAEEAAAAPVIRLANLILRDAVQGRASDIHIEPGRQQGLVRFRVDGVMREYLQLPMAVFNRVVSRIKVMGGLDIADRLRPQDGRARIQLPDGKMVDLRMSTVPTRDSEKAVIRILDASLTRRLHEVGLPQREYERVKRIFANREGIVLLTGPTGSGKTTTLYAALLEIADGKVNITTIEDPVEYEVAGTTQIQIENKRGVTFASTLRAVLRQDPNVIFVGEIRDAETAQTAAHAALTGHLVLSTLHTNDAIGVIARLVDLGLDRTMIGTALRGAVAQRLIRKLCAHCAILAAEPYTSDEIRLSKLSSVRPVRRAVGCERCAQSGYFGRTAIAEVLVITPALDNLISTGAPMQAILRQARSEGMRLLTVGALEAVTDGTTTLEEIERVVGFADFAPETAKPRVLVVDDDPVIRGVVVALLEREGFDSVQVGDGSAAIELVTGGEALDLVILDLNLPSMHGREVLRRLRAAQATQRLPVIILTGSSDERLEPELMDEGADDYLRKPIDPARFVSRVKAVLRRSARQ